jgi:peptidoglycan/LPS O-acetylase OafA/YrhL
LTAKNLPFRPDLQGLRGVAILLVILAHSNLSIFAGGFIGVDVFFVLSGYLITRLLLSELQNNGRISFARFYARRLKRLFPALVLMLVVTTLVTMWLLSGVEARSQLASSPFAISWSSNLYFSFVTFDYFDELANRDLFLHTWSLGVEEQFYLVWPIFLLILYRITQLSAKKNNPSVILIGLIGAFIISLILSVYWTLNSPQAAFYQMPSRIWQLALGGIVYTAFTGQLNKFLANILMATGLLLVIASALLLHPDLAYPGFWALFPSVGAAMLIVAGRSLTKGSRGPLGMPALAWLGDRSYSLYLWHWPIFMLGFSLGYQAQPLIILVMITLSVFAATLSLHLVELPFWKGKWSQVQPRLIILTSLLIIVVFIFINYQIMRVLKYTSRANTDISYKWRTDLPEIYQHSCDAWYKHARVEPCEFGTEDAPKTVVFLGDSIGTQWFSMITEIFPQPQWRVIAFSKSSCAIVDEDFFYRRIGKIYQVCSDWRNAILNNLATINPDVLIIGSAATYQFTENQWLEGTSRVLERVNHQQTTVLLIPGTPRLGFDGPSCLLRHQLAEDQFDNQACMIKNQLHKPNKVSHLLDQAVQRFTNTYLLDLNDLVCPQGICQAINKQGIVVYRDSQHLTDTFVRSLVPSIRERLIQQKIIDVN